MTPASIVLDAPIALDQGPGLPRWQPENYQRATSWARSRCAWGSRSRAT